MKETRLYLGLGLFCKIVFLFNSFRQFLILKLEQEIRYYNEIKKIETDNKLIVPYIKRAYNCVLINTIFSAILFSIYGTFRVSEYKISKLISYIGFSIYTTIVVVYFRRFLRTFLNKDNVLKSTLIYIGINVNLPISAVIIFEY